ncbi:MarR family winged helix-turn-helix transcriptional regulator [Jiella mangrovi]|uniref:Winged helix-turn-helix transcriptional regulator n=1 Tax=Jiella mangrovi TaxID=2821407 RepID=A0ABS4BND3_9HYPH|nr:MarR family winged helix-turn-helix transcriptional regulator [Jiella mangrovi]MBP0618190.1 winged helix-turn-helix transcriptional regulator [Jiella mangrovi]
MSNTNDSNHEQPRPAVPYTTTIRVRDSCLCLHSQRAARAIARKFDEAFRPLDLKSGQFSILMSLNRPEPPTLGEVAQLLGMDRTTLTANLKPLERRGLVNVRPDRTDKRSRRLALTEAGVALLVDAVPLWEWTQAELEEALGIAGEPDALRAGLNALA